MSDFFFFKAKDGIGVKLVTGVQPCALPISSRGGAHRLAGPRRRSLFPRYQSEATMKRRRFVKTVSSAGLGLVAARTPLFGWSRAGSPGEKVVVCVMGLNGRGTVLGKVFAKTPHAEVAVVCDVDAKVLAKGVTAVGEAQGKAPKALADFRRALDDKSIDALVIATPDHWHAPAAILALAAGKHVYLEKPCGHNAREGELLVDAQRKYARVVQMGTQQRSAPRSIEVVNAIRDGLIGQPYLARAWYANTRNTIGRGKPATAPANLDYDLWQGPAPRTPYHDNVIHYNWHWFRRWGTGEICNNGTHEIDVCRWALGVDRCVRVTSTGGRYHFDDDMTAQHIGNFVEAIRSGAQVHQPIDEGAKSVLLCHLGNIAQWTGRALRVDAATGRIQGDEAAMAYWQREYAPGWTPTV